MRIQLGVEIPMRNGMRLRGILYLPGKGVPTPTIFAMTPYTAQANHEVGIYFASKGYPFLSVDVRGRGDSQGEFHPLNEARDGYDVVEWLARQPYCNGQVAMYGTSYMGYAQWATAKEFPPHLCAIVPAAAPYRGVDSPARKNLFPTYVMLWLTATSGRTLQDRLCGDSAYWSVRFKEWFAAGRAFRELDTFLGNPSALFQEWISHPQRDAYWDSYNPTPEQYSRLDLPILTITGIYDGDQPGALEHYRQHMRFASEKARKRHYLVIGPWDHAGTRTPRAEFGGLKFGPASLVDLPQLHAQWYAWTMQSGAKPQFLRENVAYYVMAAEKWRYARTLQDITARLQPMYLQSDCNPTDIYHSGILSATGACGGPDFYSHDPRDTSHTELESLLPPDSRVDQRLLHSSALQHLVYHSAKFADDVEVSGFFKLTAWLAIDQPDTAFRVSVHEIGMDGSSIELTSDWLLARHREDASECRLIDTHEPLRYEFDGFTFASRLFRRGSRLRLVIGPLSSIHWQRNYNSGRSANDESVADARIVNARLFHDEQHPSVLHVPLGQPEDP